MRPLMFVVPLALVAAAPAEAFQYHVAVASGQEKVLRYWGSYRPDCAPGPLHSVSLVSPPRGGAVRIVRIEAPYPVQYYPMCRGVRSPAMAVAYRAARGYRGPDSFTVQVESKTGFLRGSPINGNHTFVVSVR